MARTTQPYRQGVRAPSPILDRMLAGKKLGAPGSGNAVASAVKKVTSKQKRTMPRY